MNRRADQTRQISRRSLIGTGAAAALLASSSLAARADPQRGGLLRLAAPGPTTPGTPTTGLFGRLLAPGSVFDCLTEIGPDGQLRGELAADWEPRGDTRTWVITLRRDVVFHGGEIFGADDALASLRPHAKGLEIAGLRKLGPHQIQITLETPDPGFPFALSNPDVVMLPAGDALALQTGNGTGLYRIAGEIRATGVRLRRVEDHRKDGTAGWFDTVELLRIDDPRERLEALLAGRADGAGDIDVTDRALARQTRFQTVTLRSNRRIEIAARGPNGRALADALKAGIDRQWILDTVLGGAGRIGTDTPVPLGRPRSHDPDLARAILATAGVDRATISLGPGTTGFPGLSRLVSGLSRMTAELGVTLGASETGTSPSDLTISAVAAEPTEDLALRRAARIGLSDPNMFSNLLAEARIVSDTLRRREILTDLARVLADESQVVVPVFAYPSFVPYKPLNTSPPYWCPRYTRLGTYGGKMVLHTLRIAVLLVLGSVPALACTIPSGPDARILQSAINQDLLSQAILAEVNFRRCQAKRKPLVLAPSDLTRVANGHSDWMANENKMSHTGGKTPDGP